MTDLTQRPVLDLLDEQPKTQPSETDKKGTTMTTAKKSTKKATTTTKKETTMPNNDQPKTSIMIDRYVAKKNSGASQSVREVLDYYNEGVSLVRAAYDNAMPIDTPISAIPERNLNKSAEFLDTLRYIAADLGWTDNRFLYAGQVKANGGKPREGAYVIPAPVGAMWRPMYNIGDIVWDGGKEPTEWKIPDRDFGKKSKTTTAKGKKSDKRTTETAATGRKSGKSATKTDVTNAVPAQPVQLIRMTLPDGTVVEGRTVDEVIEMKQRLMALMA